VSISTKSEPEEIRHSREENEASNLDVIGAFSPSDHLQLYYVGNANQDCLYVLASSWRNAKIVAMMGGHIRSLKNGRRWKPMLSGDKGNPVAKAIRDRIPGALSVRGNCVILRDKVYYPDEPK
jgi:hypothetical protein